MLFIHKRFGSGYFHISDFSAYLLPPECEAAEKSSSFRQSFDISAPDLV